MLKRNLVGAVLAVALLGVRCGGSPVRPTVPPPPEAPKIGCPAAQSIQSLDGLPVSVTYAPATVVGGSLPITVACTPDSGSSFPVGSTTVICTVTDGWQKTDACTFAITVLAPPRISATKFVAFGDSITRGDVAVGTIHLLASPRTSYPVSLRDLLVRRYTAQSIVVVNAGLGGERVTTDGRIRLQSVLTRERPEVLLLQEGVNDLNSLGAAGIPNVITALRSMVRDAKNQGVGVFLGTLLPQRPGGSRAHSAGLIPYTNDLIRAMAATEGADLVDLYEGFGGVAGSLIGDDGLHPNTAGYEKMAEIFFDAMHAKLEVPQATSSSSDSRVQSDSW